MECHRGSCSRPELFPDHHPVRPNRARPSQGIQILPSKKLFMFGSQGGQLDFGGLGAAEVSVLVLMSAGSGYAGRGGLLCYLGASHCDPGPGHYARLARGQRPNPHCSLGPLAFLQLKHCHPLPSPSPPHCCCLFRQ